MPLKLLLISLFLIFSCNNSTESSYCTDYLDCEVDGTWNIYYNTSTPIAGFQFNVDGVTPLSVSGGAAGFSFSTANNMVLGFSLSGFTIPAGEGVLVILEISGSGKACILADGLVVSSTTGTELPATVENCNTIQIP